MKPERRGLFLIVSVLLVSGLLGGIYGPSVRATVSDFDDLQGSVENFARVLDVVQANYAQPIDVNKVVYQGALPGMLRMLDPHSNFFDAQQWQLSQEDRHGRYYGVGMSVMPRGDRTAVKYPYVSAPAFKAGLRPGDVILKVDGKSAEEMTTVQVSEMLRGAKGTTVKITVSREGIPDPLSFTLTRDEIPHHAVDLAYDIKPGVGYIKLSGFNETTDRELTDAMKQLDASSLDGLVLDMRGNPGGLLNEAIAVSDMLLDKNQLIVSSRGRNSSERRYYSIRGNQGNSMPLVILVNNNSASATEIVTGAIQDHDRGVVVGETTFGKGLVQVLAPLSDDTGLALTIARYYTPSGRLIQRDYKSVSLYAYHYERKVPGHPTEIRQTDSGRKVTGGGGINPDISVAEPELNHFQKSLLRSDVFFPYENSVGAFALHYLANQPVVTKDFEVNEALLKDFRDFLTAQNVHYTPEEFAGNLDWVKRKIKQEVFLSTFGEQESLKVELQADPQVLASIDAVPQARALYQNARKIMAQRQLQPSSLRR
jgi:carboxyl-terminal processing protease